MTQATRPFHVTVAEDELIDLRRRIKATKWPERETVTDQPQGVQLATIQTFARYWATHYDWRKVFAAWEQPQLFSEEIRAGFRSGASSARSWLPDCDN